MKRGNRKFLWTDTGMYLAPSKLLSLATTIVPSFLCFHLALDTSLRASDLTSSVADGPFSVQLGAKENWNGIRLGAIK
jgi:hypothetical protein